MKRCFGAILTYFDQLAVEFAEILEGPKGTVTYRAHQFSFQRPLTCSENF